MAKRGCAPVQPLYCPPWAQAAGTGCGSCTSCAPVASTGGAPAQEAEETVPKAPSVNSRVRAKCEECNAKTASYGDDTKKSRWCAGCAKEKHADAVSSKVKKVSSIVKKLVPIATIEDIVPKDFSHLVRCTVNEPKEGTAGRVERFVVEDAHRPTPESAEAVQELTRELHTLCERIRTEQPQMLNKDDLDEYFCRVARSALKSCQSHVSTRLRVLVERNLVVDSTTLRVAMLRGAIATLTLAVKYFDVRDADVKCACDLHCSSYPNNTLKAGASELDNTFQFFTMCEMVESLCLGQVKVPARVLVTYAFDFDLSYYLVCTTCSGCKNTECLGATEIDAFLVCACAEAQSESRANVRAYLCDLSATARAQHAVKDHAETVRLARQVDLTSAPLPRNTGGHAATPTVADQRAAKSRLNTELRAARKQSNTSHKQLNKPRAPGAVAKRNAAKRKAAEISASAFGIDDISASAASAARIDDISASAASAAGIDDIGASAVVIPPPPSAPPPASTSATALVIPASSLCVPEPPQSLQNDSGPPHAHNTAVLAVAVMSETQDLQQQQWREEMQQQLQWDWTPMQKGELEQVEDSTEDSTEDWMDWTSTT